MSQVKVSEVVQYGGQSQSANGVVTLTFIAAYSELVNTVKTYQLLNVNIKIGAKLPGQKAFPLGEFMVHSVFVDHDGESKIKFKGNADYVELDALNKLPYSSAEVPEFQLLMKAEVEDEQDEE